MLTHPQFDPIALDLTRIGLPLQIHWYGLTYLVAFGLFMLLASLRVRKPWFAEAGWTRRDVEDLLFYGVVGGRARRAVGLRAVLQAGLLRRPPARNLRGVEGRHVVPRRPARRDRGDGAVRQAAPAALLAGDRRGRALRAHGPGQRRIGNFINGELWGRAADPSLPWAMVFPQSGLDIPRHPSQIYQFLMEGLLLFVLLWWYGGKERGRGQVSGAFLVGYGLFRFIAEYFREPDSFLGLLALNMSMGQWLCVPMILAGALLWAWGARQPVGPAGGGMRQVFLDTETTGLSPESGDRIIEIGCIEMVSRAPDRRAQALLPQPERKNTEDAVRVHGLTDEFPGRQTPLCRGGRRADGIPHRRRDRDPQRGLRRRLPERRAAPPGPPRFRRMRGRHQRHADHGARHVPGQEQLARRAVQAAGGDNSNRTLHGALLDAGLLAEVYIRLTRGQDSLVIDLGEAPGQIIQVAQIDLSHFDLPVLAPSEDELLAHEALLAELDKASGGKTQWRRLVA
jgi:phosphatidylglycerol:prolipoprotein diacylglycerol transferase